MSLIRTILDIMKMVAFTLPKVVAFIETMLMSRQKGLKEVIDSGASIIDVKKIQAGIREDTILAVKEEFHGSGSLIPEPIIRIIYEWLILKIFGEEKGYDKKLGDAFNMGFLSRNDVLDAESQINQIKKVYPEMFGERN